MYSQFNVDKSTGTKQACWGCQYDAIGIDIHDLLLGNVLRYMLSSDDVFDREQSRHAATRCGSPILPYCHQSANVHLNSSPRKTPRMQTLESRARGQLCVANATNSKCWENVNDAGLPVCCVANWSRQPNPALNGTSRSSFLNAGNNNNPEAFVFPRMYTFVRWLFLSFDLCLFRSLLISPCSPFCISYCFLYVCL